MTKVYCKKCKYLKKRKMLERGYPYYEYNCMNDICFKKEKMDYDTALEPVTSNKKKRIKNLDDLNFENHCPYYKKKWYKIWG